ncbi:MAG: AlpA family phage regulatory protein [Hyphomonadaceae bacterium]|nr:AlpA family phage regulatory protein [Hyphomonadaceae bacterium]
MRKLLNHADVAHLPGLSVSSIHRLQHAHPDFPRPLRLSGPRGKPQWLESDLEAFVLRQRPQSP